MIAEGAQEGRSRSITNGGLYGRGHQGRRPRGGARGVGSGHEDSRVASRRWLVGRQDAVNGSEPPPDEQHLNGMCPVSTPSQSSTSSKTRGPSNSRLLTEEPAETWTASCLLTRFLDHPGDHRHRRLRRPIRRRPVDSTSDSISRAACTWCCSVHTDDATQGRDRQFGHRHGAPARRSRGCGRFPESQVDRTSDTTFSVASVWRSDQRKRCCEDDGRIGRPPISMAGTW